LAIGVILQPRYVLSVMFKDKDINEGFLFYKF
jgi:hypothetical protein